MIGIILTGHGNFASGLATSVALIIGEVDNFKIVDFIVDEGQDQLEEKLKKALIEFSDLEGVVILSDLMGGTPFKTSVMTSMEKENVKVIAGTNLPMLIDACLSKEYVTDINAFCDNLLNVGKDSILEFELV